jgi:hypothetical protein
LWDLHERAFGRFNTTIGSSRIASPDYHDWPTNDKYSKLVVYLNNNQVVRIQSLRLDEGHKAPHFPNHSLYQMQLRICDCLSRTTSSRTGPGLGALAGGQGCFPFDREDYPSRTHSRNSLCGIRSLVGACRRVAPRPLSVALPPQSSCPRLPLKAFR